MKNYFFLTLTAVAIFSCGTNKKTDGIALANEVCECRKKGKGLAFADSEAKKIRLDCSKLQGDNWGKIIRDKPEEDAFKKG